MITEPLLEMRYFQPLVNFFRSLYGGNFLTLLKPSPQNEAWVGFDQGWARTSISSTELFGELRSAVQNNSPLANNFYFGFFLQFKVVERMVRRSEAMPEGFTPPYLRVELSLEPNPTTRLSQHETLLRLSNVLNASVYYSCPMLFDIADIWREPSLDDVRFVNINTSPTGWATNQRHFIAFQTVSDPSPYWKSDPVKTRSLSIKEWADPQSDTSPRKCSPSQISEMIEQTVGTLLEAGGRRLRNAVFQKRDKYTFLMPPSFTILKFRRPQPSRPA